MYLDSRLWRFTAGLRHRLVAAVSIGLVSAALGVLRLILLGWLLGLVFDGAGLAEMWGPVALVGAIMILRAVLEYSRNMVAHRTSARVQLTLRQQLYDQVVRLGPAYFGLRRTGDVLVSLVEGVEQLETYFGQYIPQLFVAALTPLMIFVFIVFLDAPIAVCFLVFAFLTLIAPSPGTVAAAAPNAPRHVVFELRRTGEVPPNQAAKFEFQLYYNVCYGEDRVCQFFRRDISVDYALTPREEDVPEQ